MLILVQGENGESKEEGKRVVEKKEDATTRETMAALYIVSQSHVILSKTAKQWRRGRLIRRDADEKCMIHLGLARLSGPCGPHAGSGHGDLPLDSHIRLDSYVWAVGCV